MANSANDITSTSQKYLDIFDITNDILILKDGSTSLILTVSAMNFGLLAEAEQDAIMYSYAGLLNSLNYPIQIVIRSQTKDVTSYLQLLKNEEDQAQTDRRRNWISRYRQFVGELIRERNVLDKKFYVVIPATSLEMGILSASTVLPGVKQSDISKIERSVILEKAREILEPKRDYLIAQFGRIGLQSRQLTTQEIIQLFYLSYNPEAAEGQQITDTNSYTTPMVQASMQGGFMDNVANQVPTGQTTAQSQTDQTVTPTPTPASPEILPAQPATQATPASPIAPAMPAGTSQPGQSVSGTPATTVPVSAPVPPASTEPASATAEQTSQSQSSPQTPPTLTSTPTPSTAASTSGTTSSDTTSLDTATPAPASGVNPVDVIASEPTASAVSPAGAAQAGQAASTTATVNPSTPTPSSTPAGGSEDLQSAINSSLQELGQKPGVSQIGGPTGSTPTGVDQGTTPATPPTPSIPAVPTPSIPATNAANSTPNTVTTSTTDLPKPSAPFGTPAPISEPVVIPENGENQAPTQPAINTQQAAGELPEI